MQTTQHRVQPGELCERQLLQRVHDDPDANRAQRLARAGIVGPARPVHVVEQQRAPVRLRKV